MLILREVSMVKRIAAIFFIYLCTCVAWAILGTTVNVRTYRQDEGLKGDVERLWGAVQKQRAPLTYYQTTKQSKVDTIKGTETTSEIKVETINNYFPLDASKIDVDLKLDYRKKGLMWYSTYKVKFTGRYLVANVTDEPRDIFFDFVFPNEGAVYDNFKFVIGEREVNNIQLNSGTLTGKLRLSPGQAENVEVSYESRGLDEWIYEFGSNVNQVKNFLLVLNTDFDNINFTNNSISPTEKIQTANGWSLRWQFLNLLSGVQIGMQMPQKLNPGPWVSEISYFAPVSLFFFFFLLFIFTIVKEVKIHPMNYFFIGTAFFSFHLLLAYLVDHVSIHLAFLICSLVSMFLVISYMRLVVGYRFALLEVGLSQFVYLVLFSYTFFFEKYTGLSVTILSIGTFFIIMQITGRVDWDKIFQKNK
jgi:inner membrane protein involved in colicin E2 resistance